MTFRFTPDPEAIKEAMRGRYDDFYGQYTTLKGRGKERRGPCPLHGGDGPNFAVNTDTGEWCCHSQCGGGGDVITFTRRHLGLSFHDALRRLADEAGLIHHELPTPPRRETMRLPGPIIDTYDYLDEDNTLLFQVTRHDPKDFRQRRPDGAGGWVRGIEGVRRVLYRLPEVIAAIQNGSTVYLVEGEKDADALSALGLCAACNPMGAGNWRDEFTETLCEAGIVILPDNDLAGRRHAQTVARALHGKAAGVRIVELPGLPEKGDVSDWIAAGGTNDALAALVQAAPDYAPPAPRGLGDGGPSGTVTNQLKRKPVAERIITARQVGPPLDDLPYLFGPYLNLGATHWMTGQTGIGKSTFVYNLAGALAEASVLWDIQCRKQRVLYLDMESGDLGRQIKMKRLYGETEPPEDWLFATEPIKLPEELTEFLAYVQAQGVTFVIFDTARRCFRVRDENDNAEVYNSIVPTLDALKGLGVAVLVLGHPPKNGATGARGAGAQEDAGDINLTLTMHRGEVSDPDGVLALRVTKNRLLGHVPPLYLRRIGEDRFEPVKDDEANAAEDATPEAPTARVRCGRDILDFLAGCDDPMRHGQIVKEMVARGHTEGTAKKAISELQRAGKIGHDLNQGYVLCEAA